MVGELGLKFSVLLRWSSVAMGTLTPSAYCYCDT
jgi:hypothetical protein